MAGVLLGWLDLGLDRLKKYQGYVSALWAVVFWLGGTTLMGWWFDGRQLLTEAGMVDAAPAPELVVVTLDERFAEHHDFPAETPKDYLAAVVRAVAAHQPRVIALDYWLTNADLADPGFDSLCAAVAAAPAVHFVFPTRLLAWEGGRTVLDAPPAPLRRHVLTGYAELRGDPVLEARLATALPATHGQPEVVPSFALAALAAWAFPEAVAEARAAAAASFAAADSAGAPGGVFEVWQAADERLSNWAPVLATYGLRPDEADAYPINYREHFTPADPSVLSSEALLRGDVPPAFLRGQLQDKLVLIGSTYPASDDTFGTPFGAWRGVLVHANILNSLLAEDPLRPAGTLWVVLLMALAFVLTFLGVRYLPGRKVLLLAVVGALVYLAIHFALFVALDRLLPLYQPLVAGLLGAAFAYWTQRPAQDLRRLKDALLLTLHVTPDGAGYRVAVVDAPEGVAHADASASLLLDEPIDGGLTLALGLKRVARGAADAKTREAVGARLFYKLFPGPVAAAYRASRRRARRGGWRPKGLRLHLHIADSRLEAIPWELAYDPAERVHLALAPALLLTRGAPTPPAPPAAQRDPLEVLAVLPAPEPESLRRLGLPVGDAAYERALLGDALGGLPNLLVHTLEHATLDDLTQHRSDPGVVHLLARVSPDGEGLVLEDAHGAARVCGGEALAEALAALRPGIVVLDAARPPGEPLEPHLPLLATRMARATGAAVLAVPAAMPDAARQRFWNAFYREAAVGLDPQRAVAVARLTLADRQDAAAGMPVLWLPHDGKADTGERVGAALVTGAEPDHATPLP